MTQEYKDLLLRYLCMVLPYGVILHFDDKVGQEDEPLYGFRENGGKLQINDAYFIEEVKPYLRPMSSMTEEEAKEISILYGIKDILSTKITDKYIEVVVDDNFSSTEKRTIWYNEIVSSIEILDWLNVHHFDYLNLIEKGLAIEITEK